MTRQFSGQTLVLATHNKGKIIEMQGRLAAAGVRVISAGELSLPEPPETGATFLENATLKALAAARASGYPALSDDSGLCVAALGGAPGVYSADWAGMPRNFRAAMVRVLQQIGAKDTRAAFFATVLVLAWPDGHTEWVEGRVDGQITDTPRGTDGFGYDPIFRPDGYAKTFAEMGIAAKKKMSHRAQALDLLVSKYFSKK